MGVVIAVCAVLAMASVVGLILIHIPERCPHCSGRNTVRLGEVSEKLWLCRRCTRYFGPGTNRMGGGHGLR
jgi:ribosomal protein L37AE/L43A